MIRHNHSLVLNGVTLARNLTIDELLGQVDEFGLYAGGANDPTPEPVGFFDGMAALVEEAEDDDEVFGDVPRLPDVEDFEQIAPGVVKAWNEQRVAA